MESGRERSDRLSEENQNLSKKLQFISDQYSAKEEHTQKLMTTRDLEVELINAKLQSASLKLEKVSHESFTERKEVNWGGIPTDTSRPDTGIS